MQQLFLMLQEKLLEMKFMKIIKEIDPTPDDLIPQFSIIRDATKAIGLPVVEMEGFEADDLIATYSTIAKNIKKKVIIISSDKDLMQLVDDDIILFDPETVLDQSRTIFQKFGVYPNRVIDVQSLAGDSSDNIPRRSRNRC